MKERNIYIRDIDMLKLSLSRAMLLAGIIAFGSCQQGQQDHSGHRESAAGITKAGGDSMSVMKHSDKDPGEDSKINIAGETEMHRDPNKNYWSSLPTNRIVIARQKLVAPLLSQSDFNFSGNGYITFDMRRNHKIPARVGGRIERLFVKYNNQYVRKGEKLMDLYSPELNTYIEEYLYIQRQTTDSVLQDRARQKLLLLGLSRGQLKQFDQKGSTPLNISVYSPFEGYVLSDPFVAGGMSGSTGRSAGMSGQMGAESRQQSIVPGTVLTDRSIREGMYVSKDQTLLWINDFRVAWGIIAIGKENEKYLREGQSVTVLSELLPGKPIETTIQLIEQIYQDGQKFSQARVYLPNGSGRLKHNSLITATFSVPVRSLVIPTSSVYDLGRGAIVWKQVGRSKAGSSIFQASLIRTGLRSKNQVEVLSGLKADDKIALDAAYLTDSETLIQLNGDQDEN